MAKAEVSSTEDSMEKLKQQHAREVEQFEADIMAARYACVLHFAFEWLGVCCTSDASLLTPCVLVVLRRVFVVFLSREGKVNVYKAQIDALEKQMPMVAAVSAGAILLAVFAIMVLRAIICPRKKKVRCFVYLHSALMLLCVQHALCADYATHGWCMRAEEHQKPICDPTLPQVQRPHTVSV